jgi:hypothetical protein
MPNWPGKLKRSVLSVRSRRNDNTIIRFNRTPKRWAPAELRMLGRLPDAEIARQFGALLGVSAEQACSAWNCSFCGKALICVIRLRLRYQIMRPAALYFSIAAVFQRWTCRF